MTDPLTYNSSTKTFTIKTSTSSLKGTTKPYGVRAYFTNYPISGASAVTNAPKKDTTSNITFQDVCKYAVKFASATSTVDLSSSTGYQYSTNYVM